jgi:putative ABC transport system permease protein
MDAFETIRTALDALLANKLRSSLTMLGIIIGVGAVISLMSIGSGAQAAIAANIKGLGANLITITPGAVSQGGVSQGAGSATSLTLADANSLDGLPGVGAVSPEITVPFTPQIVANGQNVQAPLAGVTPGYADVHDFPAALGAWFTQSDIDAKSKVVMLGAGVTQQLYGSADPTGQSISVRFGNRAVSLQVAGVLQSKGGGPLANVDNQMLLPLTTMQSLFANPRNAKGGLQLTQIVVSADSSKDINLAKSSITAALQQSHGATDFSVQTQNDQVAAQTSTTQVLTILLGAVAGISLVVGGIGVMNIMVVSVTERTREIGIRKAVGAKRLDILLQFLVEALAVSLAGGAVGILIGVGASQALNGQKLGGQPMQTVVSAASILLAASVSIIVGLIFGVYPAYRASTLNPIDALRYE